MLELSLGTREHDRVMALHDGRVKVPGVQFASEFHPTSKLFPWAVQEARFDITEMSVSSYILQLSRGGSDYTAIPAFVSRAFRLFCPRGIRDRKPCRFRRTQDRRAGIPDDSRSLDARHSGGRIRCRLRRHSLAHGRAGRGRAPRTAGTSPTRGDARRPHHRRRHLAGHAPARRD